MFSVYHCWGRRMKTIAKINWLVNPFPQSNAPVPDATFLPLPIYINCLYTTHFSVAASIPWVSSNAVFILYLLLLFFFFSVFFFSIFFFWVLFDTVDVVMARTNTKYILPQLLNGGWASNSLPEKTASSTWPKFPFLVCLHLWASSRHNCNTTTHRHFLAEFLWYWNWSWRLRCRHDPVQNYVSKNLSCQRTPSSSYPCWMDGYGLHPMTWLVKLPNTLSTKPARS